MKTTLPFRSGSNKSTFGFGHVHKAFFVFFPLVACLSQDFIYEEKVFQKTLKKVKFFNKKWQVVGKPDFPLILPVKSDRFSVCKSGPIHGSSFIWALFKRFLPSA